MNSDKKSVLSQNNEKNKLLLAGLTSAGKTSIYQVLFDNIDPKNIVPSPTNNYTEYSPSIDILDNKNLTVIDIGGQRRYIDSILRQEKAFFRGIVSLVYVLDISNEGEFDNSIDLFKELLSIVAKYAGAIPVFVFFHKFDPGVSEEEELAREEKTNQLAELLANSTYQICKNCILRLYKTSIYDKDSLSNSMADVISYGLLEDVFKNLIGGIFLEESHSTIMSNYEKMNEEDSNYQESLKSFATKLGRNISSMFKEEIAKVQLQPSKSQLEENVTIKNQLIDSEDSEPKIEELPTKDLEIEFRCPMIDYDLLDSTKDLNRDFCDITHGLLEGIMLTLDFKEVEQLQTSIIHKTPTCKFRALTSKIF